MKTVDCHLCGVRIDETVEDYEEVPILHNHVVWAALGTKQEIVCLKCYEENTI